MKGADNSTCWIWPAWGLFAGERESRGEWDKKNKTKYAGCTRPVISGGSEWDESRGLDLLSGGRWNSNEA